MSPRYATSLQYGSGMQSKVELKSPTFFCAAVDRTLEMIAKSPDIGVRLKRRRKTDAGLRKIAVGGGFGKILLVYLRADGRVELIRVLHGSRDLEALGLLKHAPGESTVKE
ncbi:MAG: type II toxin-antitoxin system RelE/ParE family toxin [Bryobacteraceae bacterium]